MKKKSPENTDQIRKPHRHSKLNGVNPFGYPGKPPGAVAETSLFTPVQAAPAAWARYKESRLNQFCAR